MEVAKNKARVVAHVIKDGIFNPLVDEESGWLFEKRICKKHVLWIYLCA